MSVGGVAPCRLSYPCSLSGNMIGDGGAGAVAAAAGTMPCLEELEWVLVHFQPFHTIVPSHIIQCILLKRTSSFEKETANIYYGNWFLGEGPIPTLLSRAIPPLNLFF
jgi:hypothetical protein